MLPPFLGALLLLATVGILVLSCGVAVWASFGREPGVRRRALQAGAAMAGLYGVFWILGPALAEKTVLPPGEAVSFCGLDCHLHVSVAGVHTGPDLGVTVRFSSNAKQALEWPGKLVFRLVDARGQQYAPVNEVPDRALQAGDSWTHELRFPAAGQASGAELVVTWKGGIDYLVPGAGNPLVQRRHRLALPPV